MVEFEDYLLKLAEEELKGKSRRALKYFIDKLQSDFPFSFKVKLREFLLKIMNYRDYKGYSEQLPTEAINLLIESLKKDRLDPLSFNFQMNEFLWNIEAHDHYLIHNFMFRFLQAHYALNNIQEELHIGRKSQWLNLFDLPENSPPSNSSAGHSFKNSLSSFVLHIDDISEKSTKKQFLPNFILFDYLSEIEHIFHEIQKKKAISNSISTINDLVSQILQNYSLQFTASFKSLAVIGINADISDFISITKKEIFQHWIFEFKFKCNISPCLGNRCPKLLVWKMILNAIVEKYLAIAVVISSNNVTMSQDFEKILEKYKKTLKPLYLQLDNKIQSPNQVNESISYKNQKTHTHTQCGFQFELYP